MYKNNRILAFAYGFVNGGGCQISTTFPPKVTFRGYKNNFVKVTKFKDSDEFMNNLLEKIEIFLSECEETHLIMELFELGRR